MARKPSLDPWRVRDEIATAAAKMIAEDGLDFASAKRKAARQVIGDVRLAGEWLPDNEHLEEEVREYQALFQADSQPAILHSLRRIALSWMERLARFEPYLCGAVLNGTAGAHSDIQLQLFSDAGKDVAIFLLNAGIDYDVSETRHFAGRDDVETLSFITRGEGAVERVGIHLAIYGENDLRGALRADGRGRVPRAGLRAVAELVAHDRASDDGDADADAAVKEAAPDTGARPDAKPAAHLAAHPTGHAAAHASPGADTGRDGIRPVPRNGELF